MMPATVGLAMIATLAIASPAKADAQAVPYFVTNGASSLCLAVAGASTANGASVIQWNCLSGGTREKTWYFDYSRTHDGALVYRLRNNNSGKCLAIGDSDTSNGAKAIQFTCGDGPEQEWKHDSQSRLRNMNSGRCLAIPGGSSAGGVQAIQWTCQAGNTNPEQTWSR
jgi:hypothetical protein